MCRKTNSGGVFRSFQWMLLCNGGGKWYEEGEEVDEMSSGHHEPQWGGTLVLVLVS